MFLYAKFLEKTININNEIKQGMRNVWKCGFCAVANTQEPQPTIGTAK